MPDIALDADGLRRDRQRYHGLLEQAEQQIAAWNERADHLQQAIEGLDRLLALAGDDPAQDGGVPRGRAPGRGVAPLTGSEGAATAPVSERPSRAPAADKPKAPKSAAAKKAAPRPAPAKPSAPPPTATPAAPEPVEPPASSAPEAPKGTDALRAVFESAPDGVWSLAELIDALEARGWLPTSRRPEEGVRISLKRLAERGGVVRTDDGRWRLAATQEPEGAEEGEEAPRWPSAEPPPAPEAPKAHAEPAAEQAEPEPPPPPGEEPPHSTSFGLPVGGTVTEL